MTLNTNDTFSTLPLLQAAIKNYVSTLPTKFSAPIIQKKLYTMNCIGKSDFHCDAMIQAILRKKDQQWVIKKMKLQHKCPVEIHSIGSEAYIFKKVVEIQEIKEEVIRPGLLVKILEERGCRIGYGGIFSAYKRMREMYSSNSGDIVKGLENKDANSNIENIDGDNGVPKTLDTPVTYINLQSLPDTFYDCYVYELCLLNSFNVNVLADPKFIFIMFNDLKNLTRNVIEIKVHEKLDGYVIYAILFDPHDFPIVYAFMVTEMDLKESFEKMILAMAQEQKETEDKGAKSNTEGVNAKKGGDYSTSLSLSAAVSFLCSNYKFIVDYNKEIFEILEEFNFEYFVKTREICKEIFKAEKDKILIEKVYGILNGIFKREGGYEKKDKRKKKKIENEEKENLKSFEMHGVFHGNAFNNLSSNLSGRNDILSRRNGICSTKSGTISNTSDSTCKNASDNASFSTDFKDNKNTDQNTDFNVVDPFVYDKIIQNIKSIYPLKEERFIKSKNYFGLQNMHEVDLDYIHANVYNFEMIECFNGILNMLKISDESENIGNNVKLRIERYKKRKDQYKVSRKNEDISAGSAFVVKDALERCFDVIPDKFYCSCGMFQSLLIPCIHACACLENPFDYVSILYAKDYFLFDYKIKQVIEDNLKNEKVKYLKVTGRPKKKRVRKESINEIKEV